MTIELNSAERIRTIIAINTDIEWHKSLIELGGKKEYHEAEIACLEELKNKLNISVCQ